MRWSITIGRFGGTAVKLHITFIRFLAWIAFSAWSRGGPAATLDSTVFTSDSVSVRCVPFVAAETMPLAKPPDAPPDPRETFEVSQASAPPRRRAVEPDSAFDA